MVCISGSVTLPDFLCLSVCLIPFRLDEGFVFLRQCLPLSSPKTRACWLSLWSPPWPSLISPHPPPPPPPPPPLSISCSCCIPLSSHGSYCTVGTKKAAILFSWLKFLSKSSCMLLLDKWPLRFQRSFHFSSAVYHSFSPLYVQSLSESLGL